MSEPVLAASIRRIHLEHLGDGDGGYAAVAAIRAFWHDLNPARHAALLSVLVEFVARREPEIWSIAWEALVQEKATSVAPELTRLLATRGSDPAFCDDLVLGLLRMGYRGQVTELRDYVSKRLAVAGPIILPLVAALARVAPDEGIALASEYITSAWRTNLAARVEKYAPSFVRHYLAVGDELLPRLVSELTQRDVASGRGFGGALRAYLAKPWMLEELGAERSARLQDDLKAACTGAN